MPTIVQTHRDSLFRLQVFYTKNFQAQVLLLHNNSWPRLAVMRMMETHMLHSCSTARQSRVTFPLFSGAVSSEINRLLMSCTLIKLHALKQMVNNGRRQSMQHQACDLCKKEIVLREAVAAGFR